jgi:hypothetical protein
MDTRKGARIIMKGKYVHDKRIQMYRKDCRKKEETGNFSSISHIQQE